MGRKPIHLHPGLGTSLFHEYVVGMGFWLGGVLRVLDPMTLGMGQGRGGVGVRVVQQIHILKHTHRGMSHSQCPSTHSLDDVSWEHIKTKTTQRGLTRGCTNSNNHI